MKKVETEKEIIVFVDNNRLMAMPSDQSINGKVSIGMFIVNSDDMENDNMVINVDVDSLAEGRNIIFYNTRTNKHFKFKLKINKETGKDNRNRIIKKLSSLEENLKDTSDKMKNKFDKLLKGETK
jgi:hypothetical protein